MFPAKQNIYRNKKVILVSICWGGIPERSCSILGLKIYFNSHLNFPNTDGGAWWAAIYGSHRVGHDGSDLAAAAATLFIWHLYQRQLTFPLQWVRVAGVLNWFSCVQLCNPMDSNLPGSSVHGISQAKILEWVAMQPTGKISKRSSWLRDWTHVFCCSCIADSLQLSHQERLRVAPSGEQISQSIKCIE